MRQSFARALLALFGWSVTADYPQARSYVLIAAPHTSNWDFPLGIAAAHALNLDLHWMGKDALFRWPYGWFFRGIGGIAVNRDGRHNMIRDIAKRFSTDERLIIALAPEGTRKHTDHWKSGFYHLARAAQVPIVMAYLDYESKEVGLGGAFLPGDDIDADFDKIRQYFAGREGKIPEFAGAIRARQ